MKDPSTKVISFPSPVPSKADYQRVKSSYSIKEIKQLFGLSEKIIRRWTEQGIIQASSPAPDFVYDFQTLTQFRRVRELRAQGHSLRQIEAELQGQLNLFRVEPPRLARLLTPFEEALLLHERGDTKAAEHYLEAINEGDNVAEAYCNLGILNLERGQLSNALDNFTLSLKNDPRHVEAHYNLANLYYDAGDLQPRETSLRSCCADRAGVLAGVLQSVAGLSQARRFECCLGNVGKVSPARARRRRFRSAQSTPKSDEGTQSG